MPAQPPTIAKRKILVCAFACGTDPATKFFGGGDTMAWNLIPRLGRTHNLWVLTAAQNRKSIESQREKKPFPNVNFVYVDLPSLLHRLLRMPGGIQLYAYIWQWRAYFVARRWHREIGFDAFHHLTYDNDWMASPTGALLAIPYLRGPGGGAHRTPREFARRYTVKGRWAERIRSAGQWIFRHDPFFIIGQRKAKTILVGNREAFGAMPRKWLPKTQLFPLSGVPREAFGKKDHQPASAGRFHIMTAGRLVRLKSFDLAIRAFAQFAMRIEDPASARSIRFCIFGEGPERERLEALARELGVGEFVQFHGWKPRAELWAQMRESDVFLFPSMRDGGGLVVVEAMAAGTPVVCTDLGGPAMHITEHCGIQVKTETPEQVISDLTSALETLHRDPELLRKKGAAARKRAETVYPWDALADRLLSIYEGLLLPQARWQPISRIANETHPEHASRLAT